ncbi:dihydrodipicolinate synthase family protein [Ferroplasma sp.]|uniref:dihydrodipicolinate synthase family protein n=1 Tax=Ferroplasma sp. TaxID=2591003 RepID=UPI0026027714|nr:dihydrodipicolinate synthase family protein [Ferroplasma sp.]
MKKITGIIPAIPTIFKENTEIDFDGLIECINFAIKSGAGAIAPMLLGGEFYKLTYSEKVELIRRVSEFGNRIKIFMGMAEPAIFPVIKLSRVAEDFGISGIILMPPYYYPYGELENNLIAKYCIDVSEAVNMLIIIQDFGYRSNMPLNLLKNITRKGKNIIGIKTEGSKSAERIGLIRHHYPDMTILGGYLGYRMIEEMNNGSDGSITGLAFLDILDGVYKKYKNNDTSYIEDFRRIEGILAIEASNLKFFVQIEKEILLRRNIIKNPYVRNPEPKMPVWLKLKLKQFLDKFIIY